MIDDPYSFIESLFSDAMAKADDNVSIAFDKMNETKLLDNFLIEKDFVEQIPFISKSSLGILMPDKLCRYRGIVQDMYGEEMYSRAIKMTNRSTGETKIHLSKYRDMLPATCISSAQHFSEEIEDIGECSSDFLQNRYRWIFILDRCLVK
jgi:hypothetical protein